MTTHTDALTMIRSALGETIAAVRNISFDSGEPLSRNNRDRLDRAEASLREVDNLLARVEVPETAERPWTKATDPIVETWVGREIEVFDHVEPWSGNLRRVDGEMLRVDYNDCGDLRCLQVARAHRQVRLAKPQAPPSPSVVERPWVRASDPMVAAMLDCEVEITTAHTAPYQVRLVALDGQHLHVADPKVETVQLMTRAYWEVRLAEVPS